MVLITLVITIPGVAGAVPQTASSLIRKVSYGLWKYIPNTVNPKPEELGS